MNRSFGDSEEVNCSCFHFGYTANPQNYRNLIIQSINPPFQVSKTESKAYANQQSIFGMKQKSKKSLKNIGHNKSVTYGGKKKQALQRVSHRSIVQQSSNQSFDSIFERENQNDQKQKTFDEKEEMINLCRIQQNSKNNRFHKFSNLTNTGTVKQEMDQQRALQFPKSGFYQEGASNKKSGFEKYKTSMKYVDYIDVDSQPKTIKRKNSVLSSLYNLNFGNDERKNSQGELIEQEVKNFKRLSIRADSSFNIQRKIQNISPKEIQSFEEDNCNSSESEVIDKGRYTWAHNGFQKKQGFNLISSLHINTGRASKQSTNNKHSKMVSKNNI